MVEIGNKLLMHYKCDQTYDIIGKFHPTAIQPPRLCGPECLATDKYVQKISIAKAEY